MRSASLKQRARAGHSKETRRGLTVSAKDFSRLTVRLKRILVPIDFSTGSKRALVYALPLARLFRAEVTLVHVVEPICSMVDCGYGEVVREWPDEVLIRKTRSRMKTLGRRFSKAGLTLQTMIRSGPAFSEIVAAANELKTDLVIIATRGRTDASDTPMGSTAERVARNATCPVLIVREREREFVALRGGSASAGRRRSKVGR